MKQIYIEPTGMNSADTAEPQPGSCSRIVNLRKKNDLLQPVGRPATLYSPRQSDRRLVFVHKNQSFTHYITYDGNQLYFEASLDEPDSEISYQDQSIGSLSDLQKVESVGNSLVLIRESGISYLLFADGTYAWLGEKPSFPDIRFHLSDDKTSVCKYKYYSLSTVLASSDVDEMSETDVTGFVNTVLGAYYKEIESLQRSGHIVHPTLVKYALQMYDGNYLLQSPPMLLLPSPNFFPLRDFKATGLLNSDDKIYRIQNGFLTAAYSTLRYSIENLWLHPWRDIITGVDVFLSRGTPLVESDVTAVQPYRITGESDIRIGLKNLGRTSEKIRQLLLDEQLFYKVGTIPIQQSYTETTDIEFPLAGKLENLELQPRLPGENLDHVTLSGRTSYVYNNKLHLGDITTRYFKGFSPLLFSLRQETLNGVTTRICEAVPYPRFTKFYIEIHLKGAAEEIRVVHLKEGFRNPDLSYHGFSPYLSYPDARAYKMTLCGIDELGYTYQATVKLEAATGQNRACYLSPTLEAIRFTRKNLGSIPFSTPEPLNDEERAPNKMRVSETDNPFYFPAGQTYIVSGGRILGLCPATVPLSQGQYGEFPLYVLTTEGIWAMQVGKESIVYTGQLPVNRDICNNPGSIAPAGQAIVYATTRGIMLLQGNQSERISAALDDMTESLPGNGLPLPDEIRNPFSDDTPFRTYLETASLGYCYRENELIVLSPGFDYYYVFSLSAAYWYRRSGSYRQLYNVYPHLIASDAEGTLHNLDSETAGEMPVALLTRPSGLTDSPYKRLRQLIWRNTARQARLQCSVWGACQQNSPYGTLHTLRLNGALRGSVEQRPLPTPLRYFRFGFAGTVSADFRQKGLSLLAESCYPNRIQ